MQNKLPEIIITLFTVLLFSCQKEKLIINISLQPGPGQAQDCYTIYSYDVINNSSWQDYNTGLNYIIAAGVYDNNTVMRSLLRFELPDTLNRYSVVSAKLLLHTYKWIQIDTNATFTINIHKMLRSWKAGTFNGEFYQKGKNNQTIDGATAVDRFFGLEDSLKWSKPGIGLNDIDASSKVYSTASRAFGDTTSLEFNISELVNEWISDVESNFGMLLRSPSDQGINGKNLSYPEIWSGDNTQNPDLRPMLLLVLEEK